MNNELKFKEEDIANDLGKTYLYLLYNARKSDYILNVNSFNALNRDFSENYGYYVDDSELYEKHPELKKYLRIKSRKDRDKFYQYYFDNIDNLLKISGNYNEMLSDINFISVPFYECVNSYSYKDFKDIILSFFSKFDSSIYNAVKKCFDEHRISMGTNMVEDIEACYDGVECIKSGYIFFKDDKFNSRNASFLVHELGHAIDSELFLFPQTKNLSIYEDALVEFPSSCFEILFLNYLINEHIDETGGLVLSSARTMGIDEYFDGIEKCLSLDKIYIDEKGFVNVNDEYIVDLKKALLYGPSYYLAYHFNEIYKNNPKEFSKLFYNFISSRKECSFEEMVNMMGIDIDEFTSCELIKDTLSNNNMKLNKRFNILY